MNRHASMNRSFRLVWNESLSVYVLVAETTRGQSKSSKRKLIAAALSLSAGIAQAGGPTGGQVTGGSGTITQSGSTTTIQQSSQNLSLNWQTFNIAPQETVDFVQPNASAIAVNRILDPNGSVILGHVNANGQVYLINPNGVLFGKGAEVNVGGLVASTLNFNDGTLGDTAKTFSGTGTGSVVNDGTLNAAAGGAIALLGNHVTNNGVISAQLGTVALGAGSAATLTFHGSNLVSMQIDQSVLNSVAANGGLIRADGGQVLMTAGAQKALLASVVNNTGIIEARTLENHEGTITLLGGMTSGTVNVGGTLDASAPTGGNGGFIETSADHVSVADGARINTKSSSGTTGDWLIDPVDFTIAASGGDMSGATLGAELASNNVVIQSANGASGTQGNVNVNDGVSWTSGNKLTLSAAGNINVAAIIDASAGAGGVVELDYGQAALNAGNLANYSFGLGLNGFTGKINLQPGNNFITKLGSDGTPTTWTVITQLGSPGDKTVSATNSLQGLGLNYSPMLSGNFVLGADINASATSGWNSGAGFAPIGDSVANTSNTQFTGGFDGLGHVVSGLTINLPTNNVGVGLFGYMTASAIVRNVGVTGANITGGGTYTGALAGQNFGTVTDAYSSGTVTGQTKVGGLLGNTVGTLADSFSTSTVTGTLFVGGLVGYEYAPGTISYSYAIGNVNGTEYVGGLVGLAFPGAFISNSYAAGNVSGTGGITGGLIGYNYATVTASSASGTVSGQGADIGGMIGTNSGPVSNSFSTGNVTASGTQIGGLIGDWSNPAQLSNSFYNLNAVVVTANGVNQSSQVTLGGLYATQYNAWVTGGRVALNLATYFGAADSNGFYSLGTTQNLQDLLAFSSVTGLQFKLVANIDLTSLAGWHIPYLAGALSGGGYALTGLSNQQIYNDYQGLIGYNGGAIQSVSVSGSVAGFNNVGGLAGLNTATVSTSASSVTVQSGNSASDIGGLIGSDIAGSSVFLSHASGSVTAGLSAADVGGLVGNAVQSGTTAAIGLDYATGSISVGASSTVIGGLVGFTNSVTVNQSFASGSVTVNGIGGSYVGGLVGEIWNNVAGGITNSYATGALTVGTGANYVGGLLGYDYHRGLTNTYATGLITVGTGATNVGGLVGYRYSGTVVTGSFWATDSTSRSTSAGGVGMTLAQIQQSANFTSATSANGNLNPNWDFTNVWYSYNGLTAPLLRAFMTPLTVIGTVTQTYNGGVFAPTTGNLAYSIVPDQTQLFGTVTVAGSAVGALHAGTYSFTPGGMYSDQLGYMISYTPGSLTINPAPLTVSGTTVGSRVYDGMTDASLAGGSLVSVIGSDTVTLTQAGSFATKNAGTSAAVVVSDSIGGASAADYTLIEPTGVTGIITPVILTVSGSTAASKVYDGTTVASLTGGSLVGLIGSDTVTLRQAGSFAAKNVGTGIAVTAADGLGGADASDYTLVDPTGLAANITPATLTVNGSAVGSKVYDGTTAAGLTGGLLVGLIGGDTVTLTQAGSFAAKNVGTGIAVSASDSIGGAQASDYTLVDPTGLAANITPATLTVNGTTVGSKVYNGNTAASLTGGALMGAVGGDTVTLNQSGMFASTSAATGIAVTATDTLSGASSADYSIAEPTGLTGSILPAPSLAAGSNGLGLAALNAPTQIVANFIYPQLGANPQDINPSPTIAVLDTATDDPSADAPGSHQAIAVNVSMKIGANGTLKIENGGLRLPSNLVIGNE